MNKWNCIIVDDQLVDRLMVVSFAKRFPKLNIVGAYASANEALAVLDNQKIDILFLDIDMPGTNGLELRKKTIDVPVCIYISSHPEYAVESFDLETLDFIVKPIKFDRFEKAMQRAEQFLEVNQKAKLFELSFGKDVINIKEGTEQYKINLFDILYLEALKDYTLLVTAQKKHCIWSNIGSLLKQETFQDFIRIHKSFAIQRQFVKKINSQEVEMNNDALIPVGRSFKDNLNLVL
jgi:two-component system, LytTR family, response regulator